MKNKLLMCLLIAFIASCTKKEQPEPIYNGHTLTIISNGKGERIVLSTPEWSRIKPQADTVTFENVRPGEYMVSVSRVRFLINVTESDTLYLNVP